MKKIIEKLSSGKGFYGVVALSLVTVALTVGIIGRVSDKAIDDILEKSTLKSRVTKQVQIPQSGVEDPRITEQSEEKETTTVKSESEENVTERLKEERQESTVIEPLSTTQGEEIFINEDFIYPLGDNIIKDYSGEVPVYDETMEDYRIHKGVDFAGEKGDEVLSVGNGQVEKVIADPSYGYIAEINYGTFSARYCGLEQGTVLHVKDKVKKGDVIGLLGDIPCESAVETHLHFEVIQKGDNVDPLRLIGKGR